MSFIAVHWHGTKHINNTITSKLKCMLAEIGDLLLICQLFVYAETVSFGCALDLLLKYGEI